jgi:hypothetical protein
MNQLKKLHDHDFNLWIEEVKERIKNQNFEDMDWDNLLDEIDDLAKSQSFWAINSKLLIEHFK